MTTRDHNRKETAALLGISVPKLDRLTAKGLIGYYRCGSRMTFGDCHIEAYRASIEVKPVEKIRRVS